MKPENTIVKNMQASSIKNYAAIDVMKFIMAIFVIALHTNPLNNVTNEFVINLYDIITSLAVPFFFLGSGFFIFNNSDLLEKGRLLKTFKKISKLYIVWTVIYLPITIIGYIHEGKGLLKSLILFIKRVLFIGENQNSWMLWYLLSSILAIFLVYVIFYKFNKRIYTLLVVAVILFAFSLVLPYFYDIETSNQLIIILKKVLYIFIPNSRILTGFVYITIGIFISKNKKIFIINSKRFVSKLTACMFVLIVFNLIIDYDIIFKISTLVCSVLLFCLALNLNFKSTKFTIKCRKYSTILYFTHMIIFTIYSFVLNKDFSVPGFVSFSVVVSCCLILSVIITNIWDESKVIKFIFY